MLDFEFYLDTGESPPVCCRQPVYGIHKRKIMTAHIEVLEDNDQICDYVGHWGSFLVLSAKPHQEECNNTNDFIWCLCVSYHPLNNVTRSFEFHVPRCTDSIEDFGDSNVPIYFISLDARSRYHQVRVRRSDQEKLALFTPSGKKNGEK